MLGPSRMATGGEIFFNKGAQMKKVGENPHFRYKNYTIWRSLVWYTSNLNPSFTHLFWEKILRFVVFREVSMRHKVTIIGAGQTGTATALWISAKGLCDIVLVDVAEGLAKGKAMDMQEAMPILRHPVTITGTGNYEETADSSVVIITAGQIRKPGMSRDDLININSEVIRSTMEQAMAYSPNAIFIVLTNPVDTLSYLAYKISGLPKSRVIGQGGILDSARFRILVAQDLGVSVESVHAYVLGGHGDTMVPMLRHAHVAGIPLLDMMPMERILEMVERTRNRGAEIINLLKTGSASLAPGAALCEMVEAILNDSHRVVPCSAYLDGEFGLQDIFFGVPVQIGKNGIEKVIELNLNSEEKNALEASAEKIREAIQLLKFPFSHSYPVPIG
jgi:malate dehydrogenase